MPWIVEPRLGRRGSRNQTDYIRRFVNTVRPGQKIVSSGSTTPASTNTASVI